MPGGVKEYDWRTSDEGKWLDISDYLLGDNIENCHFLFYRIIFKKGTAMKKKIFYLCLIPLISVNILGCLGAFVIGGAAGALGAYYVSKDTLQGETDKPYDHLWNAALMVSRIRGNIKQEDNTRGYIELEADSSRVWIRLIRLTRSTTRLRISARKYHLPNIELAQDIFVKIIEQAR